MTLVRAVDTHLKVEGHISVTKEDPLWLGPTTRQEIFLHFDHPDWLKSHCVNSKFGIYQSMKSRKFSIRIKYFSFIHVPNIL